MIRWVYWQEHKHWNRGLAAPWLGLLLHAATRRQITTSKVKDLGWADKLQFSRAGSASWGAHLPVPAPLAATAVNPAGMVVRAWQAASGRPQPLSHHEVLHWGDGEARPQEKGREATNAPAGICTYHARMFHSLVLSSFPAHQFPGWTLISATVSPPLTRLPWKLLCPRNREGRAAAWRMHKSESREESQKQARA